MNVPLHQAEAAATCVACGGQLAEWRPPYLRCDLCGSLELLASLFPNRGEELDRYRVADYHAGGESRNAVYEPDRIRQLARRLSTAKSPRLFEVGCGEGRFASAAAEAGFDVRAIEPGARYNEARSRLGARVSKESWEEALRGSHRPYDAIVAWEVIEHLPDPVAFVHAALDHLRPGGVFALSTPNAASWSIRLLGSRDPMLCPDEHLRLFTRHGLRALVDNSLTGEVTIRGFGYLFSSEVRSGANKFGRLRLPLAMANVVSAVSRGLARTDIALGLEVFASRAS